MFCKNHIVDLQRNRDNQDLVTKLSVKYQIPSMFTSFIAVKKLIRKNKTEYEKVDSDMINGRVNFEVKTLTGKTLEMEMTSSDTIDEVK
mmetsp:Transcript_16288/g.16009  ORF Transcript_16288/g.16009 Transcript_16288/m.16009 type:complete len:89 (-) Transcript_16288:1036-1302(-)